MKKVAIYTGVYPNTSFLTLLARTLADNGIEVHIYGRLIKKTKEDRKIKFYTYSDKNNLYNAMFFIRYFILNLFSNYKSTKEIFKLLRDQSRYVQLKKSLILLPILYHKPDVIHIQWLKTYELFKPFETLLASKIIISLRGVQLSVASFLYPKYRELTIEATNSAVSIHSISDDLTNQLLKINPFVKDKIVKINPAIDLQLFASSFSNMNRNKNKPLRIISVCRLTWIKGLEYAINALKMVKEDGVDFEYIIVGAGDMKEELQYLVNDLELNNQIKLVGSLFQEEVKRYLEHSDIFLLPSVEEGFSNAVIEAQALGLPCLVSNTEGLIENIEHGKTGFVFEKRNVKDLAEHIKRFDGMSEREFVAMRHHAVFRANKHFNVTDQIKEFVRLYESC